MGRKVMCFFTKLVMGLLTDIKVLGGLDNLPKEGPALLVINHLGRLDAFLIFIVVQRSDLTGWVADKYKKTPLFPLFVRWLDAVWLHREGADLTALKWARASLEDGRMLGIAPEGTRSLTGRLNEGRNGVAYLAAKTGVEIIPAAITGTEATGKAWRRLRRPRLTVRFGEPFTLPPLERGGREEALRQGTIEVMCRIAALLPPKYRGFYSDHPRLKALLAVDAN